MTLPFIALLHHLFLRRCCQKLGVVLSSIGIDSYVISYFKADVFCTNVHSMFVISLAVKFHKSNNIFVTFDLFKWPYDET